MGNSENNAYSQEFVDDVIRMVQERKKRIQQQNSKIEASDGNNGREDSAYLNLNLTRKKNKNIDNASNNQQIIPIPATDPGAFRATNNQGAAGQDVIGAGNPVSSSVNTDQRRTATQDAMIGNNQNVMPAKAYVNMSRQADSENGLRNDTAISPGITGQWGNNRMSQDDMPELSSYAPVKPGIKIKQLPTAYWRQNYPSHYGDENMSQQNKFADSSKINNNNSSWGEAKKGFQSGIQEMKGIGYGTATLVGKISGDEKLYNRGVEGIKNVERNTPRPDVASIKDVKNGSDLIKYGAYNLSSEIPGVLISIASGGVGSFAGKKVAQVAAKKAIKENIIKKVPQKYARQEGYEVFKKRLERKGALGGQMIDTILTEPGKLVYRQIVEGKEIDPKMIMQGTAGNMLIDLIPGGGNIKKSGGKSGTLINKSLDATKTFATEGAKDAARESVDRAVSGQPLTASEALDKYSDKFVIGGTTGLGTRWAGDAIINDLNKGDNKFVDRYATQQFRKYRSKRK